MADKKKKNNDDIEILDFDIEPPMKKSNKKINSKNKNIKKKRNNKNIIISILSIIIGITVVISGIFATKIMLNNKKQQELNRIKEDKNKEREKIKNDININDELRNIIDINNYVFTNSINVYTKNNENSIYKINNTISYNDNIYKIDKIQTIQNIDYKNTDYYAKVGEEYFEYINDLTSNTYTRNLIDENNFNSRKIMNNFISYLLDNYKNISEKIINLDNKDIICITLSINKDILNNLPIKYIDPNFDINKLNINQVIVDLYFNKEDKKISEINFKIEDKFAYQADIGADVEYSTVSYKLSSFNTVEEISLPY